MGFYNNQWESVGLAPARNIWIGAIFNPNDPNTYDWAVDNTGNAFTLTGKDAIKTCTITQEYGNDQGLTFGLCNSAQLKLTVFNPSLTNLNIPASKLVWQNSMVKVWFGVTDDNGDFYDESGWAKPSYNLIGTFFITEVSSTDGWQTINLVGYDYLSKLNVIYEPSISFPARALDIYNDIKLQYFSSGGAWIIGYYRYHENQSVTSPTDVDLDATLDAYLDGTVADYIGWLAGLLGTNAMMMPNNALYFSDPLQSGSDFKLKQDVQYMSGLDMQDEEPFVLQSITSGTQENPITSGNGTGISYTNPLMTQSILDGILTHYDRFTYYPMSCSWRCYPEIFAGDCIRVQQHDGIYYPTLIFTQVFTVDGGLKSDITSRPTQARVEFSTSPMERKIERMYTNLSEAIATATDKLSGAKGGVFRLTDSNNDGVNDGFLITQDPTATAVTKCIVANYEGIGLSTDGGATYTQAITHDGINADVINAGHINAERIKVSGETLADYLDIGVNGDGKVQLTIGARDSSIRLAEVNDQIAFVDGDNNALMSMTSTTFDMGGMQRFRLGNVMFIIMPNGSLSLVGVT
jgi:hypothetical protein